MSQHRPTVAFECDVFPDETNEFAVRTPAQVAAAAWSDVKDWVANGYQPVVTVHMEDGTEHIVDLEEVEGS